MATQESTMQFLAHQLSNAGAVHYRKMFGEYALYCDNKVVALVCDDKFFVKITEAGKAFAGQLEEAPPYPGAKPYLLVEEDHFEDEQWMSELIKITAAALPIASAKKKK